MKKIMKRLASVSADLFFPPRCPLCESFVKEKDIMCENCEYLVQRLPADANFPHLSRVWFSKCRSRFSYDGPVKDALHSFKYNERLDLATFFAKELFCETQKMGEFNLIVPVPLHPARLGKRGFNQSAVLAKLIGRRAKTPVDVDVLVRIRNIEPQVSLEKDERIENVKGAFAVREKHKDHIAGKDLLVIDDVATTGATINECSKILIKAGAAKVSVLTVSRVM